MREKRKRFSKNQDKCEVIKYKKLSDESKTLKKNLWWEVRQLVNLQRMRDRTNLMNTTGPSVDINTEMKRMLTIIQFSIYFCSAS